MTVNINHQSTMDAPRAAVATLVVFLGIAFIPALIGTAFPPDAWYEALAKPSWNPSPWVFGPVWAVLYTLIGYAGYLAWCSSVANQRYAAFSIFAIHLLLNALWTPLFFGYHSPSWALVSIIAQWPAIAFNIVAFYRIKPAAGLLLAPVLLWVTFALLLNTLIWTLNR